MPNNNQRQTANSYQQVEFDPNQRNNTRSHFNPPAQQNFKQKGNGNPQQQQQQHNQNPPKHQQNNQPKNDPRFYVRVSSFPFTEYDVVLWFPDSALFDGWGQPYMRARRNEYWDGYIYWPADGSVPHIISMVEEPERFNDFQAQVQYTLDILALGLMNSSGKRPSKAASGGTKTVYRADWRLKAVTILSLVACCYLLFFRG